MKKKRDKSIYVSLLIDEHSRIWFKIFDRNGINLHHIKNWQKKLTVKQFRDKISDNLLPADWNRYLIIINFHLHVVKQGIPDSLKQNLDIIKLFKYHVWANSWEGPQKLVSNENFPSNVLPIFENICEYSKLINCNRIGYIDSDLQSEIDFNIWKKTTPSNLELIIECSGELWSDIVFNDIIATSNLHSIDDWINYRKKLPFNYSDSNIFWCYNRVFREGKAYIIYNLLKENLLSYGKVSYYGKRFLHKSYIDILAKILYDKAYIDDVDDFTKFLKSPDIKSDKVNAIRNLANVLDKTTWTCPINICTETNYFEENLFFNEKTLKPIMLSQLILPMTSTGLFHELSKKYGFIFSDITLEIDKIENKRLKMEKIIYYLKFFIANRDLLKSEIEKNFIYFEKNMEVINNQVKCLCANNVIHDTFKKIERYSCRDFSL